MYSNEPYINAYIPIRLLSELKKQKSEENELEACPAIKRQQNIRDIEDIIRAIETYKANNQQ